MIINVFGFGSSQGQVKVKSSKASLEEKHKQQTEELPWEFPLLLLCVLIFEDFQEETVT